MIVAVPMTWYGYQYKAGAGAMATTISTLFTLGISSILLPGTEPAHFPERLGRYFTTIRRTSSALMMASSWKSCVLVIGPFIPLLISITLAGLFDHSFFPDRPTWELHYTLLGVLCLALLIFSVLFIPVGLWCTVSQNHVVWAWTYFGKNVWVREYSDATMVEYARTNGSAGGPVVTIRYGSSEGEQPTAKLKFRNLVDCTREEFGDLLTGYLGNPERRVTSPTKGNMFW
ncbi:hypothetical protein ACT3SZ_06865 [Corynebacterium sp. AOP40-9SA-29]|uniref:hypothetical protein n=1 Tax=Corynebacterium sp. AOP40-9SA-29 TaxID=3457677 RepID=UPI004033E2D4